MLKQGMNNEAYTKEGMDRQTWLKRIAIAVFEKLFSCPTIFQS